MKIVIFGTGKYYQRRKEKISLDTEIIAFLDNDPQLQGKMINGIQIFAPQKIKQLSFDKIVLMSARAEEMKQQLIKLDVSEKDIWSWKQLNSEMWHGVFKFYVRNIKLEEKKKKILIISTDLDYNGGTLAVVYAAMALQKRDFRVLLAAPAGVPKFISEVINNGINVVLCPGFPYLREEELFLIKQFDVVLVNVFQMVLCANEISGLRPTIWWIHEPSGMYNDIIKEFPQYMNEEKFEKISIYAVSNVAQRNFNYYFPSCIQKTLFYGIPDLKKENILGEKRDGLVFAVIGAVCPIKAQEIFVRAARLLKDKNRMKAQFWIIGFIGDDEYSNEVKELVLQDESFKLWGQLTRGEMQEIFRKIDVVVCPSLEDCLPIVVTEGMMYQKVCVVSDHTGSANLIVDGVNGYVVPAGDVLALKEKMELVIDNLDKYETIGKNARETYEKYFSMEVFGNNLEKAVKETINLWGLNER